MFVYPTKTELFTTETTPSVKAEVGSEKQQATCCSSPLLAFDTERRYTHRQRRSPSKRVWLVRLLPEDRRSGGAAGGRLRGAEGGPRAPQATVGRDGEAAGGGEAEGSPGQGGAAGATAAAAPRPGAEPPAGAGGGAGEGGSRGVTLSGLVEMWRVICHVWWAAGEEDTRQL